MSGTHPRLPKGERVDDLLDDPIAQLVMRRDGLTREDVLAVVDDMRGRLYGADRGLQPDPSAHRVMPIRLAA